MLRYLLVAWALKAFSLNGASRSLYRRLGNTIGAKRRAAAADIGVRIERGDLLVALCRRHGVFANGDRMLEVGTGWMHWYSIYAALFDDRLRITAMDVWDNRQFPALMAAARELKTALESRGEGAGVLARLDTILAANDFDDIYRRLHIDYLLRPQGGLGGLPCCRFDAAISFHVMEHVRREALPALLRDMRRVLKPGGHTIHQIGIDDHLTLYDRKASPKQYLAYSDLTWRTCFENDVQYFNRIQASEWRALFADAGFMLVDEASEEIDVGTLKVHPRYSHLPADDHACTLLTLVHRKPDRS